MVSIEFLRIMRLSMLISFIRFCVVNGIKVVWSDCISRSRRLKRCLARIIILRFFGVLLVSEVSCAALVSVFLFTFCAGINFDV